MPERKDLLHWGNLQLSQEELGFCLSLDGVLLADFVTIKQKDVIGDLGTGNGALPLLLYCRSPQSRFTGLELQPQMAALAHRNVAANHLEDSIKIVEGNLQQATMLLGKGRFTLVVSNPPFFTPGTGRLSPHPLKAAARSELFCTLEDVIREGSSLLNSGGRLALIHRPERLSEICVLMERYGVTPKRLRLVQPKAGANPNLLLMEGIRGGKPGLTVEAPLLVYEGENSYSAELEQILAGRKCRKG